MGIPFWEDNWEKDEDGNEVWAPYLITYELPPGPPVRWGHWPGVFENGK